ncbi:hypothetical protein B0H63DRAFT_430181 [Podospora didyma]|uniref:Iron-sulfur assembly protein 1 n=1 Tax=Podospora didyma TaxID=330526 RepID=A0AAE0U0I9_9PEZI|nr:hypothetical protein B0H63DRAFT_430181 [Podospora didyma]
MNAPRLISRRTNLPVCLSCRRTLLRLRQFSSTSPPFAAAFQSYQLPSQPPTPPRNATSVDTSITRSVQQPPFPHVHETRPPKNHTHMPLSSSTNRVSIPEQEAQKSKPTAAETATPSSTQTQPSTSMPTTAASIASSATAAPTASPAPKPRSKLRAPRKAAMKLTPAAVDHLRALLDQPEPKLIKVGVRNRGCSGLAYHLEFVDKVGSFDETVEQDGVRVLIDSKALFSIIGSEMDWVEDKLSQRFVFRNPNIKEECGCGESFMV